MVKIRTETYFPRFRVGASSEVAAKAVSSLIPAPPPAMAMPANQMEIRMNVSRIEEQFRPWRLTDESVHVVCSAKDYASNNEQGCSNKSNISTANEIGKGSHEGTDACQSEQVCKDLSIHHISQSIPRPTGKHFCIQTKSIDPFPQYPSKRMGKYRLKEGFNAQLQSDKRGIRGWERMVNVIYTYRRDKQGFGFQSIGMQEQ